MTWADELAAFRRKVLDFRDNAFNDTNPTRTDYYLRYWRKNPEIPWTLMAHLVSRNAGYQMSDLARFRVLALEESPLLIRSGFPLSPVTILTHARALWALLETGNFLILRDILPQLEIYRKAKQLKLESHTDDRSDDLFGLLSDKEFDADPFIVKEWRRFFTAASSTGWDIFWMNDPFGPEIVRLSMALVVNEQNQIHDRLIADEELSKQYFGPFGEDNHVVLSAAEWFNATKLCFPAHSSTGTDADYLLLYNVQQFDKLEHRINVGRDLFSQLIQDEPARSRVQSWASSHPTHHGSRADYNPLDYALEYTALLPGGLKWSPPLMRYNGESPAWYDLVPSRESWYRPLYRQPALLRSDGTPWAVESRPGFDYTLFLEPARPPGTLLIRYELHSLGEIFV